MLWLGFQHGGSWWHDQTHSLWAVHDRLEVHRGNIPSVPGTPTTTACLSFHIHTCQSHTSKAAKEDCRATQAAKAWRQCSLLRAAVSLRSMVAVSMLGLHCRLTGRLSLASTSNPQNTAKSTGTPANCACIARFYYVALSSCPDFMSYCCV